MSHETIVTWSDDRKDVTFSRTGFSWRAAGFVERLRDSHPILAGKLPAGRQGLEAIANAGWLSREEYSGALRDQAFKLIETQHFIQDLSSGTTGEPVLRYHAWSDECSEQLLTRRVFELAGVGAKDRVVCLEIGAPEISAFYFRAFAELGVLDRSYLHVSTDFLGSIEPLERLDPTVLLTVPGILARCGPRFFEIHDGRRPRALRRVINYAEPLSPTLREKLLDVGIESYSFYGTTELGGTAGECKEHDGLHVQDDWILPTLRDAVEVSPGRYRGEIGWTAMHFGAQPVLKYAVGDLIEIETSPCPCGEPGVRMHFVERVHDLVCVYGLKFGFASIERSLAKILGEDPLVQLELTDAPKGMEMIVKVCRDHGALEKDVVKALYEVFEFDEMLDMGYLTVKVEQVERATFDRRKLRRVVDRRAEVPFCAEVLEP